MVEIFQVVGSFGIKGGMKIRSYADDLGFYKKVYDSDGTEFSISVKKHGSSEIVFLDTVTDRNASDALRGKTFYVKRSDLRELGANQFYICDLVGQEVSIEGTDEICTIVSLQNYGAGDLLELKYKDNTYLVPFTKQNFPDSDDGYVMSESAFRGFIQDVAG